ncbi:MAG: ParB N-terminal domain-containing protein [Rhodobacteraceae bacterium]|nr:ParB N-terminal domain-containing protein [Paracoccaceae bacterium]
MENVLRLDLHFLNPRFAPLRLRDPERLACLTRSMRQHGQLMPVVVVPGSLDPPRWVLIDGYRRLEALREIGEDLLWVDAWDRPVDEALLLCLARGPERGWEAIEEAALLHELSNRYSLRELAQRIGCDVSWVSRRLNLFKALPEELLEAVRTGNLSVWAATRILAPLARANSAHARTLPGALEKTPLSTRELERLFAQYQRTPTAQRERLVANPDLFIQAIDSRRQAAEDKRLAEGPEGAWCKDLVVSEKILRRLTALAPTLFSPQQERRDTDRLQQPYARTKAQFQRLEQVLGQVIGHDPL